MDAPSDADMPPLRQIPTASPLSPAALRTNLIGGIVGNVLEWYDFAVYGFFAPAIASQFFPSANRLASLLGALGVFACAYLMRPLGGVVFGHIGDRLGRKTALQISVLMMALPTTAIGLLPTTVSIGGTAAVLLVLLRLLQGLSVGGELVGSISFITELAPTHRRGLYGSFALCSSTGGILLGSIVALAVQEGLGPGRAAAWGWRLPFLAGLVIGLFGLWMREGMDESPQFERTREADRLERDPVREVLRTLPDRVLGVGCLVVLTGGGFYMLFVWWPTLLSQILRPPIPHALLVNSLAMLTLMVLIPGAGWLSDLVGRAPVILLAAGGMMAAAYPLFTLVEHGTFSSALGAQLLFAVLISGACGPMPATMAELFPPRMRLSGVGVGYNTSLALFGGTAPLISTWLVARAGIGGPAIYLMLMAATTFLAAWWVSRLPALPDPPLPRRRHLLVFPLPPPREGGPGSQVRN